MQSKFPLNFPQEAFAWFTQADPHRDGVGGSAEKRQRDVHFGVALA
jgi:hypothetical protein